MTHSLRRRPLALATLGALGAAVTLAVFARRRGEPLVILPDAGSGPVTADIPRRLRAPLRLGVETRGGGPRATGDSRPLALLGAITLELGPDVATPNEPCYQLSVGARVFYLGRPLWRFEGRYPAIFQGRPAVPQGLAWLDTGRLVGSSHADDDTLTFLTLIDPGSGQALAQASSRALRHMNSLAVDPVDGALWALAHETDGPVHALYRLDPAASFARGEITVTARWDVGDVEASSVAFASLGGSPSVLVGDYAASGDPVVTVFDSEQMTGPVSRAARVRELRLGTHVQDIAVDPRGSVLYASRNARPGDRASYGWIDVYELDAFAHASDGARLVPVASYPHASAYAEAVACHPSGNRLWVSTEGLTRPEDEESHMALWSTSVPPHDEAHRFELSLDGQRLSIDVDGRRMVEAELSAELDPPESITVSPSVLVAELR